MLGYHSLCKHMPGLLSGTTDLSLICHGEFYHDSIRSGRFRAMKSESSVEVRYEMADVERPDSSDSFTFVDFTDLRNYPEIDLIQLNYSVPPLPDFESTPAVGILGISCAKEWVDTILEQGLNFNDPNDYVAQRSLLFPKVAYCQNS